MNGQRLVAVIREFRKTMWESVPMCWTVAARQKGWSWLLRSMAPQVIAVDEIGNYEDIRAIEMTLNSGCKLLATVHGSSIDEIRKKPLLERLIKEHVFERYIILQKETAGKIGKVREIYDERGTCLYQRQRSVC